MEGLRDSVEYLRRIVSDEGEIVTPARAILLGLSQGCATGKLRFVFSCQLPLRADVDSKISNRTAYTTCWQFEDRGICWTQWMAAIPETT